ncbi:MAG: hypothetical protein ABSG08_01115 [Terriglobales bacterium]|jgi:hypothetical protein
MTATVAADTAEILRTLDILHQSGQVVELRCPKTSKGTISGYYDNAEQLASRAAALSGTVPGVYITLNPVHPDLLCRRVNHTVDYARDTTTDADILSRRWLPLDFDPVRAAGISATDAEHDAAIQRASDARDWLHGQGWSDPILADSGNGGHLLYRIELPNDAASLALVERTLKAVAQKFSDQTVTVDVAVGNAARIWKVYGTLAAKGDSTAARPHRFARLLGGAPWN